MGKPITPPTRGRMAGVTSEPSTPWDERCETTRLRRKVEKHQLRQYLDTAPEVQRRGLIVFPFDVYDVFDEDYECVHGCVGGHGEPCRASVCLISCHMFTVEAREGCRHGCSGCERFGSDVCTFLCHPRYEEIMGRV